jgi:Undecaprenyl-phosphate glucose phosphotransferase
MSRRRTAEAVAELGTGAVVTDLALPHPSAWGREVVRPAAASPSGHVGALPALFRLVDGLLLVAVALAAGRSMDDGGGHRVDFLLVALGVIGWMVFCVPAQGGAANGLDARLREIAWIGLNWGAVFCCAVGITYLVRRDGIVSREWALYWAAAGFPALVLSRLVALSSIRRWRRAGRMARRVLVVSYVQDPRATLDKLQRAAADFRIADIVSIDANEAGGGEERARLERIAASCRALAVDEVVVVIPPESIRNRLQLIDRLADLPATVKLCHELPSIGVEPAAPGGAIMYRVYGPPQSRWTPWQRAIKRGEDLVLGIPVMVSLAPLMLLIALAIKLEDGGAVLFRQRRYGLDQRVFTVFKFRTMRQSEGATAFRQACKNDARVTRVGAFLRRTSLDELPQLLNVLRGDMSLVGPRPHPLPLDDNWRSAIAGYAARHRLKPGITGWAQVNGYRGETDTYEKMCRRFQHDVYYIEHWSLAFDLAILLDTIRVGFLHPNAY